MTIYAFITNKYFARHNSILVFGRGTEGRVQFEVMGFEPYFYVPEAEANKIDYDNKDINRVEKGLDFWDKNLVIIPTLKIICYTPNKVTSLRKAFDRPFEADIPFERRFLIDRGITDHFVVTKKSKKIRWDEIGVTSSIFDDFDDILLKANIGFKPKKKIRRN